MQVYAFSPAETQIFEVVTEGVLLFTEVSVSETGKGQEPPLPREGAPSPELLKQTGLLLSHHAVCSARSSQIL